MGHFSTFTPASRSLRDLGSLGDVASCERMLLADLANQYFYAAGSGASGDAASRARVPELKRVFERAYLSSSNATEGTLTQQELLGYLQAYIGEKYPALAGQIDALPLTETAFSSWAAEATTLQAPSTYMTVAQAEAAMAACRVPVSTPDTSGAAAQAERERLAREATARAERERLAREATIAAGTAAAQEVARRRQEAERLAAAASTDEERAQAAAAQADADRLAAQVVTDFRFNPRWTALLGPLDPRIAVALRNNPAEVMVPTNYTPWLIGGGLILAAILVTTSKTYITQKKVTA